MVIIKKLI